MGRPRAAEPSQAAAPAAEQARPGDLRWVALVIGWMVSLVSLSLLFPWWLAPLGASDATRGEQIAHGAAFVTTFVLVLVGPVACAFISGGRDWWPGAVGGALAVALTVGALHQSMWTLAAVAYASAPALALYPVHAGVFFARIVPVLIVTVALQTNLGIGILLSFVAVALFDELVLACIRVTQHYFRAPC